MDILISFGGGVIIALAGLIALRSWRESRSSHADEIVAQAITAYFDRSGVVIAVDIHRRSDGRLLVLVESEPLKKFRYSYVIEKSLIEHIQKNYDRHIEHVFWRFPIQHKDEMDAQQGLQQVPAPARPQALVNAESNVAEPQALPNSKAAEDYYKVDEISWENYESALQPGAAKEGGKPPTAS